jgi:hypothetical protein
MRARVSITLARHAGAIVAHMFITNGAGGKLVIVEILAVGRSPLLLDATGARSSTGNGVADGAVLVPINREILRAVIKNPSPMLPALRR